MDKFKIHGFVFSEDEKKLEDEFYLIERAADPEIVWRWIQSARRTAYLDGKEDGLRFTLKELKK